MTNDVPFDPKVAFDDLSARIAAAAQSADRASHEISLIGISKVHGPDRIMPVLEAGLREFGENRVQEAQQKWPALKARFPDTRLHLVGPLQTNKIDDALALFDVLHSVDREKLARKLADALQGSERKPRLFIQVNTGEEPQKAGIAPLETDDFIAFCREDLKLPIDGLMCLPPVDEEPSLHFALLAKIARRNGLSGLSMGMTGDFETAIALGATHVRIGTALFGPRPARPSPDASTSEPSPGRSRS